MKNPMSGVGSRGLSVLSAALFLLWLLPWGYTIAKMSAFHDIGYRNVCIIGSLFFLNLWAVNYAIMASRRFSPENSPIMAALAAISPGKLKFVSWSTTLTPLIFSAIVTVLYAASQLSTSHSDPNWPSPALPAVVSFGPMVFIFGILNWRTLVSQDRLLLAAMPKAKS